MILKPAFSTWLAAAALMSFLLGVHSQTRDSIDPPSEPPAGEESQPVPGGSLDPLVIPKYVDPLTIPAVLYDDNGGAAPLDVEIAMRQFDQQVLPTTGCPAGQGIACIGDAFPSTTLWGYGNPADPGTFNNPAFTVEVTQNIESTIKWTNGLVDGNGNYLPHILQAENTDPDGPATVPVIDQTLHWAAPNGGCKNPSKTKDCATTNGEPYFGPVPMTVHVHGAHVGPDSDGYPESWWLPAANDIPAGYSTEGTYYNSTPGCVAGQGCAVDHYSNDQPTSKSLH